MNGSIEYTNETYGRKINAIIEKDPELEGFYKHIKRKRSEATCKLYMQYVHRLREKVNGDVCQIDIDVVNDFLEEVNNSAQAYHSFVAYASYIKAKRVVDYDFMDGVEKPVVVETEEKKQKRDANYLNDNEIIEYLENAKRRMNSVWDYRNYAMVSLMLTTGVRVGAICKMDVDSVDFDRKIIVVNEKGRKTREVSIPLKTSNALAEWVHKRNALDVNTEALFITNRCGRISDNVARDIVKKFSVNGKIVKPHTLRATGGTKVAMEGGILMAQKFLGHANPQITEKYYVRGQDMKLSEQASNIMGNALA